MAEKLKSGFYWVENIVGVTSIMYWDNQVSLWYGVFDSSRKPHYPKQVKRVSERIERPLKELIGLSQLKRK
jgi:hypothetical protein